MFNISEFLIKLIGVKFYFRIYEIFMSLPFYFFRIFSIKKNKIVLCNFDGKGYGDNPKYIAEELIKNNVSRGNSEQVNYSQIFSKLKIKGYPYGYDLLNNTFVNTIEKNIIDSAKSVRAILWNSITMVSMIITTE